MSIFKRLLLLPRTKPTLTRRGYRPWVEILEDRLTPTTTANVVGTTLQIIGDNSANTITFRLANGDPTKTVILDGTTSLGSFSNASFTAIGANLNGGDDSLTLDSSNGNPIPVGGISYDAGTGINTFTGPDVANTWNLTGVNAGTLNTTSSFKNVVGIVGGAAADTFKFSPGGSIVGSLGLSLDGGGGINTLDYSPLSTRAVVDLSHSAATGVHNASEGYMDRIQSAIGSHATTNLFVGPNPSTTWVINDANGGTVGAGTFTAFQNITGSGGNDTFKFASGGSLDGNLDGGGGGINTLDYSALSTRVVVSIAGAAATGVNGALKNNVFRIQAAIGSSATTNLFVGPNADSTWNINAANGGSVGAYSFTAFQSVAGSTGNDTFKFGPGGNIDGTLDGGTGSNTLDYSALPTRVVVSIAGAAATGVNSALKNNVYRIQAAIGGSATMNLFVGPDADAAWNIISANAGSVVAGSSTFTFSAFPNLAGGNGKDTFKPQGSARLDGYADGGAGANILDYSGYVNNVVVDLAHNAGSGFKNLSGGGINRFQTLIGTTHNPTNLLVGSDADATWNLTGNNSGTLSPTTFGTITFSNFAYLTGGFGADTFKMNPGATISGAIDGRIAGSNNTLDYSNYSARVTVSLAQSAATGIRNASGSSVFDFQNIIGNSATTNLLVGPIRSPNYTWNLTGPGAGNITDLPTSVVSAPLGFIESQAGSGSGPGGLFTGPMPTGSGGTNGSDITNTTLMAEKNTDDPGGALQPLSNHTWVSYNTWAYQGFVYIPNSNGDGTGTIEFAEQIDDNVLIKVDGLAVLSDASPNSSSSSSGVTLSTGYHRIDFRFSNDAGPGGATGQAGGYGWPANNLKGFGYRLDTSRYDPLEGSRFGYDYYIPNEFTGNDPGTGLPMPAFQQQVLFIYQVPTITAFTFTGFPSLQTNVSNETFKFQNATAHFRMIQTYADTFDYSNYGSGAFINLAATGFKASGVDAFTGVTKFVGSTTGSNTVHYESSAITWYITNNDAFSFTGSNPGAEQFVRIQNIVGGSGGDDFIFSDGVSLSGSIDGGTGSNILDYSAWTAPVTVDLSANTATAVSGGIAHFQSVIGGAAADNLTGSTTGIIIGNGDADHIVGGSGRYVIIGGAGADTIQGGPDSDLIIAGTTDYDTKGALLYGPNPNGNLFYILKEWQSMQDDYATRIAKLRSGVGNAKLIFGTTVHDDSANNIITGDRTSPLAGALDWFFINTQGHDTITDLQNGEQVN